jgi:hypothetical protein
MNMAVHADALAGPPPTSSTTPAAYTPTADEPKPTVVAHRAANRIHHHPAMHSMTTAARYPHWPQQKHEVNL